MSDFIAAVLRSVTWRAVVITQGLAAVYALIPWFKEWGHVRSSTLAFEWTEQSLTALFVLLAAFAADEAVRRGWRVLSAFAVTLLCASLATGIAQWSIDGFFRVGGYWGTVLLVYLNRQSAARLLARLRAGELA